MQSTTRGEPDKPEMDQYDQDGEIYISLQHTVKQTFTYKIANIILCKKMKTVLIDGSFIQGVVVLRSCVLYNTILNFSITILPFILLTSVTGIRYCYGQKGERYNSVMGS